MFFLIPPSVPEMFQNMRDDEIVDDVLIDENSLDLPQLLETLREEIKFDETIAMKSALLLKLLEVSKNTLKQPFYYLFRVYLGHIPWPKIHLIT